MISYIIISMKNIMIFGAADVDIAAYVKQLPKGNEEMEILHSEQRLAGAGIAAAKTLQGLKLTYDLMAPCGTGVYGDAVREMAEKEGITLHIEREGMNGCTYHMIDPQGRSSAMRVPGVEYDFDENDTMYADADDILALVVFGDMLSGENAEELLTFADRCDVPLYFIPDGMLEDMDEDIKEALLDFQACWILREGEAGELTGQEDMDASVEVLCKDGSTVVMIGKDGLLCRCDGEDFRTPSTDDLFEEEETIHAAATAFVAVTVAGVDKKNALMFACGIAERMTKNGGVMDDFDWTEQRQRLVRMITYKA